MTVKELITKIKTKALAYGIKQDLLNDDNILNEISNASDDFTVRTKSNLKQVTAVTIADQPFYTLPSDIIIPVHMELADYPIANQTLVDFWYYKRDV